MAFEERTERRVCPQCGAKHRMRWYRLPVREPFKVLCKACEGIMHQGTGVFDYYDVRLDDSA